MSQVTLLSVDVAQPIDSSGESEFVSSSGNDKRFADLVDQHMSNDGNNSRKDKVDGGNSSSTHVDSSANSQEQIKKAYEKKALEAADQQAQHNEYQDEHEIGKTLPINETLPDDKPATEQLEQADSEALLKFLAASKNILLTGAEGKVSEEQLQKSVANELGVDKSTLKQMVESITITETKAKADAKIDAEIEIDSAIESPDSKKAQDKTAETKPQTDKLELSPQIKEQLGKSTPKEVIKSDASSATLTSVLSQKSPVEAETTAAQEDTTGQDTESADTLIEQVSIKAKAGDSTVMADDKEKVLEQSKANSSSKAIELEKPMGVQQSLPVDKNIADSNAQLTGELSQNEAQQVAQAIAAAQAKPMSDKQPQVNAVELNSESKVQSRTAVTEGLVHLGSKEHSNSSSNKEQNNQSFAQHSSQSTTQLNDAVLIDNDGENTKVGQFERELADKSLTNRVAETLAQSQLSSQLNTAKAESNYLDEQAHEQFVEHISHRVVKENTQVQKTQLALDTISVYRKDFANEVKEKVMVMINQKLQQVDIQLDPPELGNMHVRVNLQNEQASVSFTVQNQQAKDALEQHMNKLKEMLADSGVDVGNADIRKQNQSSQEEQQNDQGHALSNGHVDEESIDSMSLSANMVKASAVGIDFYA